MARSQQAAGKKAVLEPNGRGTVICIDSRRPDARPRSGEAAVRGVSSAQSVTQGRLAEGLHLHLEEMRIAQALRAFRMQVEADLAAGCQIESGDLLYDLQLKIVRKNVTNAGVGG
jgi:hypothetical protein